MKNITANAFLNCREIPNLLHIHGSVVTYHSEDRVKLVETQPRSNNPLILLTDLNVISGLKSKKGNAKLFRMDLRGEAAKKYQEIHIRYNDGEDLKTFKIEVETFGKKA